MLAVVKQLTYYCSNGVDDLVAFLEDDLTGAALDNRQWGSLVVRGDQVPTSLVFPEGAGFHFQVTTLGGGVVDVSAHGFLFIQE